MLSLIDWRREIFEIYSDIRTESNGKMAWEKWRVKREELFKHHPESPTFNIKSIPGVMLNQFYILTTQIFVYHLSTKF